MGWALSKVERRAETKDDERRNRMTQQMYLGGTFPLPDESMTVNRMGYGAMQLAGPQVWGTAA